MLLDQHRAEWMRSGVSAEIISRNVWTIEDPRELDMLLNSNTEKRWKHSAELVPGWAVAGVGLDGERTYLGAQYKPDNPRPSRDESGEVATDSEGNPKRIKYESPRGQRLAPLFLGMPQADYWQDIKDSPHDPIIITEGAKKAGAALSVGFACISLPGVSTGQKLGRLRPELLDFCGLGRRIFLAFDSDIITKRSVQNALDQLGRLLSEAGAVVSVVQLPTHTKGLDDFLVSGDGFDGADGDLAHLLNTAPTLEEWRTTWRAERDAQREQAQAIAQGRDVPPDGFDVDEVEPCLLARRYNAVNKKIGSQLRYNLLKGEIELNGERLEIDDIQLTLALEHNLQIPDSDAVKIVTALAKGNGYHPIEEYLNNVAQRHPAAAYDLDEVAPIYFGTSDPLHRCYIRKTLISAVARALDPGCKVDTVMILQGGQGVGKSSWFQNLLPLPEWFDDSLGSASDKDERLKLHQAWILEWGELERLFRKRDISQVKAFVTTQVDYIRPPYGRGIKAYQRRSILVGSTNDDEFLVDSTGNRRFWVVPVSQSIPLHRLESERDLIWAAAVWAYRNGERWELPPEMRKLAAEDVSAYEVSDPWAEVVLGFCEDLEQVQIHEVLGGALKLEYSQQDRGSQNRVGAILRQAGWISRRGWISGKRPRLWFNPRFSNVGKEDGSDGSQPIEPSDYKDSAAIHPVIHPTPPIHPEDGSQTPKTPHRSIRSTDPSDPSQIQTFELESSFQPPEKNSPAFPQGFSPGVTVGKRGKHGWIGELCGTSGSCALVHWSGDEKASLASWAELEVRA